MPNNETIKCNFSIFDTGRQYTGNHRKYILENARTVCYDARTRERIKLRDIFGYYGHGRRLLCDKFRLDEVDVATLPDGTKAIISNVPSNVTLAFDIDKDGTVSHEQQLLLTETGEIVRSLHQSKVGGFSWACPGEDRGPRKTATMTGFAGFDYVLAPGYATNRGYILESANNVDQLILESVSAVVSDDLRAERIVAGWRMTDASRIAELEDAIFESEGQFVAMHEQVETLQGRLVASMADAEAAKALIEQKQQEFKGILESVASSLPFFIPEDAMHQMLEGDFTRAKQIFESASMVDYSQYPLGAERGGIKKEGPKLMQSRREPCEYGTADYGFGLKL